MFYRSFGTQNLMVTLIFKFDARKGQLQLKLGQIRSDFKIQNFVQKYAYLVQISLRISKNVIYFYVRQLEMPKMHFINVTSLPLPVFLAIAQPKTKIML